MDRDWLLTLEVGGAVLRYSSIPRVVDGDPYDGGLDPDLEVAPGEDTDVAVSVQSEDLHAAICLYDTGTARLDLLDADGSVVEVASGRIVDPSWGAPGDDVEITISRHVAGSTRGSPLPDPTARVDSSTWPLAGDLGTEGGVYPVILGYPGSMGAASPVCCVPVPIAQITGTASTTYVVVSEDRHAPITEVRLRLVDADAEFDQPVSGVDDLLGKEIRAADCSGGGATSIPSSSSAQILAGYSEAGGGGPVRDLYSVIRYLLRRWGAGSADWARLPEIAIVLERYQVDSFTNAREDDPWVLIEHWISELPVEIRASGSGLYLVERRHAHDPARVVGALVEPVRAGRYRKDGDPYNEVAVSYRYDRAQWLSQVILTGSADEVRPGGTASAMISESEVARRSRGRYDRIQGPAVSLDWTWDDGTALEVASALLARAALPATLVEYDVHPSEARGLREGDELLITDPDCGWTERPGIVAAPPRVRLDSVRLSLRVPEL